MIALGRESGPYHPDGLSRFGPLKRPHARPRMARFLESIGRQGPDGSIRDTIGRRRRQIRSGDGTSWRIALQVVVNLRGPRIEPHSREPKRGKKSQCQLYQHQPISIAFICFRQPMLTAKGPAGELGGRRSPNIASVVMRLLPGCSGDVREVTRTGETSSQISKQSASLLCA